MSKQIISTDKSAKPGRPYYSQGVVSAGKLVFTAGRTWDPRDGRPYQGDVKAQVRDTLEQIKGILEAGGATMDDVVKVTVYARNIEDLAKMADIRMEYFGKSPPASTILEVSKLWHEDVLVEIDAIAVVSEK